MKKEYDPEGEDYLIEKAVSLIESGRMNYFKRVTKKNPLKKQLSQPKRIEVIGKTNSDAIYFALFLN